MKRKPDNTTDKVYYIHIERSEHSTVTREGQGEWDNDDLDFRHDIHGFSVVEKENYWDFVMTENPKGKTLELVYVLYSTGDSFHHEENRISLVGLYETYQDAKFVMDFIESDYREFMKKDNYDHKPSKLVLPVSGKTEDIYTGTWKGYFERLTEVNIESVGDVGKRKVKFGY